MILGKNPGTIYKKYTAF